MKLAHVSASQVELFNRCERAWFFQYVLKIKPPTSPWQERGTAIHSEVEHYLRTGEIRPSEYADLVRVAAPHLPLSGPLLIEHEIGAPLDAPPGERGKPQYGIPTFEGGPKWVGFIDLLQLDAIPTITDHKSTSDFKNCKTEEELAENTQLLSYAKYVFDLRPDANQCELEHVYIRTKGKPAARVVSTVVERSHVLAWWSKILITVRKMCAIAESVTEPQAVEPNTDSCGDYGGCPHLARCGVQKSILGGFVPMKKSLMEKLDQIQKSTVADVSQGIEQLTGVPAESAPAQSVARVLGAFLPGAVGVLPPDAPARETTPAEAEALAAPKKRGRPKKTAIQNVNEFRKVASENAETIAEAVKEEVMKAAVTGQDVAQAVASVPGVDSVQVVPQRRPFFLVINTASLKAPQVLATDWMQSVFARANELAMELNGATHWLLLGFGPSKVVLATALKEALPTVPEILYVDKGMAGADVLLEVLGPHAANIFASTR